MTTEAGALRSLASYLRSGCSLRQALYRWPDDLKGELVAEASELARRVRLGCPIVQALEGLPSASLLRVPIALHLSEGLALAEWLESAAAELEATANASRAARAASAGAVLSGRLIAGLPLLFVLLAPLSEAPMTDPLGIGVLVLGVSLALAGLCWIDRLVPRPSLDDEMAGFSSAAASLLESGAGLWRALDVACRSFPMLGRAPRLVRLGSSWPEALVATDDRLGEVAGVLRRAAALGTPVAPALRALAVARRSEAGLEFDRALRRAPVLMTVPLVCCVLPSYALLGLVPFLRSISLG